MRGLGYAWGEVSTDMKDDQIKSCCIEFVLYHILFDLIQDSKKLGDFSVEVIIFMKHTGMETIL